MELNTVSMQDNLLADIKRVRDGVGDGISVKQARETYLPHPSDLDKDKTRYDNYLMRAEWDAYPQKTLAVMLGRMKFKEATIELPTKLDYLIEDFDGDGLSIHSAMQQCASEDLTVRWGVLLADYKGLSGVPVTDVSIEQAEQSNVRATVKRYKRESVIKWHFERVNGVNQLTYLMLEEVSSEFDQDSGETKDVKSYLILRLRNGQYTQQKFVESEDGESMGEELPIVVAGKPMQFIPVVFFTDGESVNGSLPAEMGFIKPIVDKAFSKYVVSADYKESMHMMPPTVFMNGLTEQGYELFKTMNGRESVVTGNALNFLPDGATIQVESSGIALDGYERYFAQNKKEAEDLGAVFDADNETLTATEASINAAERTAALIKVKDGIEDAFKRIVFYCGIFEGVFKQDSDLDGITIDLVDDFTATKLTPEEASAYVNMFLAGVITKERCIKQLQSGGWLQDEIEQLLSESEEDVEMGSTPSRNNNNMTE